MLPADVAWGTSGTLASKREATGPAAQGPAQKHGVDMVRLDGSPLLSQVSKKHFSHILPSQLRNDFAAPARQ